MQYGHDPPPLLPEPFGAISSCSAPDSAGPAALSRGGCTASQQLTSLPTLAHPVSHGLPFARSLRTAQDPLWHGLVLRLSLQRFSKPLNHS
jgi:hypothetical protein